MATARKTKDGYYVVSYRDQDGKGRSRSFGKGREGKKRAEQFATEVDFKKAHGEALPLSRAEGIYLDELCQLWVDEKKAQGRKSEWLREWVATFNKVFLPPLCKHPAHRITQTDVIDIINSNYANRSQATRNRYVQYLKGILEFGVMHGHIKTNPLSRWRAGKETGRSSQLTLEALQAILRVAPPHLRWALEVAWNIPCRPGPSDLFALRFDMHFQPARGGIKVHHTKVDKEVFITLEPTFVRAIAVREKQHKSGHLIEFNGKPVKRLDTALATAAKRAELPYQPCLYDVRHLWITTAMDKGLEPSVIAYMAGTSVEMIHSNYYEAHAVERARVASIMPKLHQPGAEPARKVVGIDEARLS